MPDLVSIIVPAYNAATTLADTLTSAIAQTWPNKEIIVVNDGSTDQTLAIAKSFESATVKILTQDNAGAASARNTALRIAQGTYLQFLDADDILAPEKLSRQLAYVETGLESRVLLSCAWGRFYSRTSRAKFRPDSLWRDMSPVDWLLHKFNDNRFMMNAAWIVSRRLSELAGPWDARLSLDDDGEYACRLVRHCRQVRFSADAVCYYRVGNIGTLSWQRSDRALASLLLSMRMSIGHLLALEDSERTREACLRFLSIGYPMFYPDSIELSLQAQQLAESLGGRLSLPNESPHFVVAAKCLGQDRAQKARVAYNRWRFHLLRRLEDLVG